MLVVVMLIVAHPVLGYSQRASSRSSAGSASGAALAILVWIAGIGAFGFYVANFSTYDKTYGSLAGVIVFLLWLWITNLALLFGAELDAELERGRELQAGIAAEEEIQLPPGTPATSRRPRKGHADEQRGRRLRETRGGEATADEDATTSGKPDHTGSEPRA